MYKIKVSDDFTKAPGGRLKSEGDFSGEEFREKLLSPMYQQAKENSEKLIVNLNDCYGFATSFVEEAFGGLVRETGDKDILKHIEIISDDEPGLIEDISEYVKNAIV